MKKENERYKKEIQNNLNGPRSQIKVFASSQSMPQYIEVTPNIEGKQIVSTFSAVLFWQSNPSLLKDGFPTSDFSRLLADHLQILLHDTAPPTEEGILQEAQGAVPDDRFPDRLHKDGEGMQALRLLPERGG
jgi:hypothetical protein